MTLSIILPIYNEEEAIRNVISNCIKAKDIFLTKKMFENVEIIAVDDGSNDNTLNILENISNINIIKHKINQGYGTALMLGFHKSEGDILAFLDADNTYNACELYQLAEALKIKEADMIIGNRMHSKSKMPRLRVMGNKFFIIITSLFLGKIIGDVTSGMRIFRRKILDNLMPLPSGLDFTAVMTAKALTNKNKLAVYWVPISYSSRQGISKLKIFQDGFLILKKIIWTSVFSRFN